MSTSEILFILIIAVIFVIASERIEIGATSIQRKVSNLEETVDSLKSSCPILSHQDTDKGGRLQSLPKDKE